MSENTEQESGASIASTEPGLELDNSTKSDPKLYDAETYDVDQELKAPIADDSQKKDDGGISWKFILLVIIVLLPIRLFVAEPFLVYGSSMEPNFETGDYLIVDELSYKITDPKRGDVIVLKPPYDLTRHFIKRIVGLPGETIDVKGDIVTITNKEHPEGFVLSEPYLQFKSDKESKVTLTPDQYFVMGDNRTVSYDSRSWGPLPKEDITGKALLRLYPFKDISILPGDSSKF